MKLWLLIFQANSIDQKLSFFIFSIFDPVILLSFYENITVFGRFISIPEFA